MTAKEQSPKPKIGKRRLSHPELALQATGETTTESSLGIEYGGDSNEKTHQKPLASKEEQTSSPTRTSVGSSDVSISDLENGKLDTPMVEDVTSIQLDDDIDEMDDYSDGSVEPMFIEGVKSPVFEEPNFSNEGGNSDDAAIIEEIDLEALLENPSQRRDGLVRKKSFGSLSELIEKDAEVHRKTFTSLPEWLSREASFSKDEEDDDDDDDTDEREEQHTRSILFWVQALDQVRAVAVFLLYTGYYARDQLQEFSRGTMISKVSGVAFLCFMAQVPCEGEEVEKLRNASLRSMLFSRKTILLLCYVYLWHTGFDQTGTIFRSMGRGKTREMSQGATALENVTMEWDPVPNVTEHETSFVARMETVLSVTEAGAELETGQGTLVEDLSDSEEAVQQADPELEIEGDLEDISVSERRIEEERNVAVEKTPESPKEMTFEERKQELMNMPPVIMLPSTRKPDRLFRADQRPKALPKIATPHLSFSPSKPDAVEESASEEQEDFDFDEVPATVDHDDKHMEDKVSNGDDHDDAILVANDGLDADAGREITGTSIPPVNQGEKLAFRAAAAAFVPPREASHYSQKRRNRLNAQKLWRGIKRFFVGENGIYKNQEMMDNLGEIWFGRDWK